jgi:hypothetical protein
MVSMLGYETYPTVADAFPAVGEGEKGRASIREVRATNGDADPVVFGVRQ